MSIHFDSDSRCFHLETQHSSYQFQVDPYGFLLHLYYGPRIPGCADYLLTYADRGFSGNPYDTGKDRTHSLDALPQEFPFQGSGDYRSPLLVLRDERGAFGCDLRYQGFDIAPGLPVLEGLPAVYTGADDAEDSQTLSVHLLDTRLKLKVTLLYGVLPQLDVIVRSVLLENQGAETVTVQKLQSACLDFVSGRYDLLSFSGRHAMERSLDRRPLLPGETRVGSRRGQSSHQFSPFVILADHSCTEDSGQCWAMSFVYSGGFGCEAGVDQYGQTRLQMGLAEEQFAWPLSPGDIFTAPEVLMSFSAAGLSRLSHNLHRCIRRHVCRGKYRDTLRPVLLNSWEASYFNFTGNSILDLADEAKSLGIDMLVLDDGWFGNRVDDNCALGDWTPNEEKLGRPLGELVREVNRRGLKFGIWMEPEMVSEESSMFRQHPDWVLTIPGKAPVRSRYQLVLDLSRQDVCDYIFDAVCAVLDQGNIEYLKWDFNRSIADVFSHKTRDQGTVLHRYVLGLYGILERLNQRYPDLLIEGCAGGGGRFDAGMLYYCPQIWCSDNTDAIDRLRIQHGTSFGFPVSAVGSHVSACPNHQTGRTVPLQTRSVVAMSGSFGYELNPAQLSDADRKAIPEQLAAFRRHAPLIQNGLYYRLSDPASDSVCAWSFVSEDGNEALIFAVLLESHGNMPAVSIFPRGLKPDALYREETSGRVYPAGALMSAGLPLPLGMGEYESACFHLLAVSG